MLPCAFHLCNNYFILPDLPEDHQIHDLASLANVNQRNFKPEQLGMDAIKEQQAINLENSSKETAFIPKDQVQVMLAMVSSARLGIPMHLFIHLYLYRVQTQIFALSGHFSIL